MFTECAVFAACLVAGELWPRRASGPSQRWWANLALFGLGWATVLALGDVFDIRHLSGAQFGLLHALQLPPAAAALCTFLAYDLYEFGKHRLLHAVPCLWRLHAVHHSDTDLDASTHFRHHPLEQLLSLLLFAGFVLLLGPEPFALGFALLLHRCNSLLNHSNIALPLALDRVLRRFIVTPDMHRIHHSAQREETDSNFGNLLSCWDRLFGTWVAEPAGGQQAFELGLREYTQTGRTGLWGQLCGPFTVRFGQDGARGAAARVEMERR